MAAPPPPSPPSPAELLAAARGALAPAVARLSAAAAAATAAAASASDAVRAGVTPHLSAAAAAATGALPPDAAAAVRGGAAAATATARRLVTAGPPPSAARALDGVALPLSAALSAVPALVDGARGAGVDVTGAAFARAAVAIAAAPLIWNAAARVEFGTGALSRVFGRRGGCWVLAAWIFGFSLYRDALFVGAMREGAGWGAAATGGGGWLVDVVAGLRGWEGVLGGVGGLLVGSSMWRLGVTGTYLGDYFGILMPARVTGFPFSWTSAPMYDGSTLLFLAKAIAEGSPVGLVLTVWVYIVYSLARAWEDPFTAYIYERAAAEAAAVTTPAKKRQ